MDGILIVNKPADMTSHDVINRLRKILQTKKIGHTGTLDPQATGVLVVLVGKACKILQFLNDTDKTYRAGIQLGYATDTMDVFGTITQEKEVNLDFDFEEVLKSFQGKISQLVPMTSAKKIHGKKLMEYQRQNIEIDPIYQDVEIYSIRALNVQDLTFEVHCSSGTYVRSICYEFAKKTNNEGCMKSLERVRVGRFSIEQAQSLEEIEVLPRYYPIEDLLSHIPRLDMSDVQDVLHGKKLCISNQESNLVCIYHQQKPLAIYERVDGDLYASKRGLW